MRQIKLVTGFLGMILFEWAMEETSIENSSNDKKVLLAKYKDLVKKYHQSYYLEKRKLEKSNERYDRLCNLFKQLWKTRN